MNELNNITPYEDDSRQKGEQVNEMFDSIAPKYDFMNHAMTLGIDHIWRRRAVNILRRVCPKPSYILDIATGTADLAIMLAQHLDPIAVTGVDLSEEMLARGKEKVMAANLSSVISLHQADCMQLPFPNTSFDCITAAFGVRNFQDLPQGYAEMFRVMRPGGTVLIIELSTPTSRIVKPLYGLYSHRLIPAVGRLVSKDKSAYSYLPSSIEAVPQGEEMAKIMRNAGFSDVKFKTFTFGVCTVYIGKKPQ